MFRTVSVDSAATSKLPRPRKRALLVVLLAGALVCSALLAPLAYLGLRSRYDGQRTCSINLRQIAIALDSYRVVNGRYPPPFVRGTAGIPMHSWRTLVAPYTDYSQFFCDAYDYREPWNSASNRLAAEWKGFCRAAKAFSCPSSSPRETSADGFGDDYGLDLTTNYVMVTYGGKNYYDATGSSSELFRQGVVIAEVKNSGIHWAEPRDIEAETLEANARAQKGVRISSGDPDGPIVLLADGTMKRLDPRALDAPTAHLGQIVQEAAPCSQDAKEP